MDSNRSLSITPKLAIPLRELSFSFSRSGGSGGQNVNKVNTRVTLQFDVARSPSLSDQQRALISQRLASRISRQGLLQVISSEHRTQGLNREAAVARFCSLLRSALHQARPRRATKVSRATKQRRLKAKQQRSQLKQQRKKDYAD